VLVALWSLVGVPAFVTGLLCGIVVTAVAAMTFWFVDHTAGAQHKKFGTYGEETTAELFGSRAARRRGWEIRHNLWFEVEDVDHVAFGPDGVFAIESKWANAPWPHRNASDASLGAKSIDQARRSARHVRCLLRSAGLELHVTPVVIQWGPGGWDDASWTARWSDGVFVLRGGHRDELLEEIDGISGQRLTRDDLDQVRKALDARVEGRPSPATELLPTSR
jgi:hypothetical protein